MPVSIIDSTSTQRAVHYDVGCAIKLAAFPKVTIIIVNMNGRHHLQKCLPSVFKQNYDDYEVMVVDNASTDGSIDYIEQNFPKIRIIKNGTNFGYAGANNVGFQKASGEYIAVLNPDTQVHPDWLLELIKALQDMPKAGLATPKILLMDQPNLINTCGNNITYTGLTVCRGLQQPACLFTEACKVPAVSGAAFVIKKEVLDKIGGFDENFFTYYEETDLSLRALLAGYECHYVPASIILHKYAFRFSSEKCYYQERNRYYSLLKTFKWPTFIALFPELLISEILAWGYAILKGPEHIQSKLNSYAWLIQNRQTIHESRVKTQKLRRVSDHAMIKQFSHQLTFAQTISPSIARILEAVINPILFLLGKASCMIVRW
ncbi:MAG: glycosyltransferase family 2 protein [Omnitrophica WOR_2 bacterium]